ncbi:MAG: radical SAM protein [Candidatus Omnitrophica bacterium]|nr:radical SAM protein [Candidatus Omnitrophota bacterium]
MDVNKYLRLLIGIFSGRRAFTGPYLVQLDLTNACNTVCLYCMNYSTLGLKKEYPSHWQNEFLDMATARRLIPELKALGVKEIDVTGNGEPFMHPDCIEILRLIKSSGIKCLVRTNGLFINQDIIDQLLAMGLNGIDLSLWAGTPQGYAVMHPGESEESFLKIYDWLQYLAELRDKNKVSLKLRILNVVGADNFRDLEGMLSFASEIKADYVLFKYAMGDFFRPEIAGRIQLSNDEKIELIRLSEASVHKKRVRNNLDYFIHALDRSFKVDRCYFGWLYARVTVTGGVIPCCGCTDKEMGNFKENIFSTIWFGTKFDEFRQRSRHINTDPFFSECSCSKICPHYMAMMPLRDVL